LNIDLSVVVPVYNEDNNINPLYREITSSLSSLPKTYEIVFVDDGSNDNTFQVLKEIQERDKRVKIIKFRRNFGKSAALNSAFNFVKGNIIITMDGDLQDNPQEIPSFVDAIEGGSDLVSGWKYSRKDPLTKKMPSKLFNKMTRLLTGVDLHDFNCGFKAYKKEVLDTISLYGEMHRYIPALAAQYGFKITELKVEHRPRSYGKSKYGFSRLIKGFLDLITVKFLTEYSTRPLHVFGIPGILSLISGVFIGLYLVILKYWKDIMLGDRPLLLLSILLIILGLQFVSIGLLGEMITFRERKDESAEKYIEAILDGQNDNNI
jgi:glycosyltransferase involved in cell wall biosynthesis